MPRKKGATFRDVADACGLSPATVDRVINGRGSVTPATERRVLQAARQLGLDRVQAFRAPPNLRFHVLLLGESNPFFRQLSEQFLACAQLLAPRHLTCHRTHMEDLSPRRMAEAIERMAQASDGLVVVAYEHPLIRRAVNRASARLPVVTLLTDLPTSRRVSYVGSNNYKAGRVAGELMGRFLGEAGGEVLVISGMERFTGHRQRVQGFEDAIARHGPRVRIVGEAESGEHQERAGDITAAVLHRCPDLAGVYSISSGNSGIADALSGRRRPGHTILIGHEATTEHLNLLAAGRMDALLDQHPFEEAMQALKVLLHRNHCLDEAPTRSFTPVSVLLRESI